jgi:hypothetical protein
MPVRGAGIMSLLLCTEGMIDALGIVQKADLPIKKRAAPVKKPPLV